MIFFSFLIDLYNEYSVVIEIQDFAYIDFCYVLFNNLSFIVNIMQRHLILIPIIHADSLQNITFHSPPCLCFHTRLLLNLRG